MLGSERVEDLVADFLNTTKLEILSEKLLGEAVHNFVQKEERDSIKEYDMSASGRALMVCSFVQYILKKTQREVQTRKVDTAETAADDEEEERVSLFATHFSLTMDLGFTRTS